MTLADEIFEILVIAFAIAGAAFLTWWTLDIRKTRVSRSTAWQLLKPLGITPSSHGDELTIELIRQNAGKIFADRFEKDHTYASLIFSSLFILRHDLGLSKRFFYKLLELVPERSREHFFDLSYVHISKDDAISIVPSMPRGVAQRLNDNAVELLSKAKRAHDHVF